MHERFRKRIEALEEMRKQLTAPSHIIVFRFVSAPNRTPLEATIARGRDFTCRRGEGETLESFQERAISECHERYPCGMPTVLIFSEEASDAARS
jgi:hypothetical protein